MATGWRAFGSAQLIRALAILIIALASIGMHHTGWFGLINGKLLDAGFQTLRKIAPRPVEQDVAVVGIDVEALRVFSEPRDFWHANYGKFLIALAQLRPSAVGLDVVFPERSYQHLIPGLDQALLQGLIAMRGKVPVVLARTVDDFSNFREIFAPYVAIAGTDSVGSVVVCKDDDEVIRRFDEFLCGEDRGESIPSLAGVMAKRLGVERPWRGLIDYRIGDGIRMCPSGRSFSRPRRRRRRCALLSKAGPCWSALSCPSKIERAFRWIWRAGSQETARCPAFSFTLRSCAVC
jgi:CHASE2 domain-containing sensor protein